MAVRGENSLFFSTGLDNSGLQSGANDAAGIVQGLAGTIAKINPFAILATGAITAFATVTTAAYNMMREYEQAMKEVQTISQAAQNDFKGISSQVFELSEISPDDPVTLANAYYQIVSAGYDGAAGLELLETAAKAATAGVTDTQTAADGITTVLNAFKLEAEEAGRVADVMFNTVRLGKTNFEELSSTLSEVAPLAAASGFSFEEVAAAVASLTKQGVPTSQAMTQLRSAIESVTEVLGDGAAKSMTLQNAFQAIYDKAGGSQNELKQLTGRMEAMNAILAITGPNAQGAAADLAAMGNAAGSTSRAFGQMAESNVNQWKILRNRIKATTQELGNAAVEMSSLFARSLNEIFEENENVTSSIRRQANEFNSLRNALESANIPFQEKFEILTKLKDQYPEYLRSLDLDEVNNSNLEKTLIKVRDALREINDEQERRLRTSGANQRLVEAENRAANELANFEEQNAKFFALIEDVKDYAARENIELDIDFTKSPEDIAADVFLAFNQAGASVLGDGAELNSQLLEISGYVEEYRGRLAEANDEVEKNERNLEAVKRATYDNAAGAKQIVAEIKELNTFEELSTFDKYTNPEINEALKERQSIVAQLSSIQAIQDVESLKPFLESEIEEVRKYAEERQRMLNTNAEATTPKGGEQKYSDYLKSIREQYKKHQAVLKQVGEEAANEQFGYLLEQGENYGEFLKNQLKETTNFAKQQAIAVEAEVNRLNLNRGQASSVNSGLETQPVKLDLELDTTSINYIERQISELQKKFRAATTNEDRNAIQDNIRYWQERLDTANSGADTEKDLYEDIYRTISDMTYQGIRDYIKYWKERLDAAEKGSQEEAEILGRIADAQNKMWDKVVGDINDKLGATADILREAGQESVAGLLEGLQSAGNELNNAFKAIRTEDPYEMVNAGLGSAIELTGMLVSASQQRKQASEDYYNAVIAQQREYNRLLNEELRTREGANENVFTEDYENRIRQGVEAYDDAQQRYMESLRELSEGQVQEGVASQVNWGNVLGGAGSGAALGATIGSVVPVIGTVIGGAVGAIAGGLAGLFGGRESSPEYTSLLGEFPDLIERAEDGTQRLNDELAQTLINQELVNEETRGLLENTLAWQEQMEAAREQIRGVIEDLAGGLGNDLRTALVDAFQSGESAAIAMGDTISNVLENIISQLIFDQIFAEQFRLLEEQMEDSFAAGGDGTWVDDFQRFFQQSQGLTDEFNNALSEARDIAENAGFDVFGSTNSNRGGMSGAIQNITEDTANILEGYMNAIRLDTRQGVLIAEQSSIYLSEIAQNTRYNRYLESIDNRMGTIENGILEFQSRS